MLCSDAGNGGANNATFTLSDAAATDLPLTQLVSGTYKPDDYEAGETQPAPAPAGPYPTALATFNGQTPNGTWSLFVLDDSAGEQGAISGGWTLAITTVAATLQWAGRDRDGDAILRLEGLPLQRYEIEGSASLDLWTPLGTAQPTNGAALFTNSALAPQPWQFYRARALP